MTAELVALFEPSADLEASIARHPTAGLDRGGAQMKETKKNQSRPVRLTLVQAVRIVWLVDDVKGSLTPDEKAIMEPLVAQVQLLHAQIQGEMAAGPGYGTAWEAGGRGKPVDKSR